MDKDVAKIDMAFVVLTMLTHIHTVIAKPQFVEMWIKCFTENEKKCLCRVNRGFDNDEYVDDKWNDWHNNPIKFLVHLDSEILRAFCWEMIKWYETYEGRDSAAPVKIIYDNLGELAARQIVPPATA